MKKLQSKTILPAALQNIVLGYCFENECEAECKNSSYRFFSIKLPRGYATEYVPDLLPDYESEDEYY